MKIGNSFNTSFWKDISVADTPFMYNFQDFFQFIIRRLGWGRFGRLARMGKLKTPLEVDTVCLGV